MSLVLTQVAEICGFVEKQLGMVEDWLLASPCKVS